MSSLRLIPRLLFFPFRLLWILFRLPGRAFQKLSLFFNQEPEEHPLGEILANLPDEAARQQLVEHLEAFRAHLLRAVIAVGIGIVFSFFFTPQLIEFLARPVGGLSALKAIEVTESIGVFMRVALMAGLAIALPYVTFEFWLFAAPGLKPGTRKFSLLAIPLVFLFFIGGMAFAYYLMLPAALPVLLNFMGIQTELRPNSYFSFVTGLMFWIGVFFEFPFVIYLLTLIGWVRPQPLLRGWRVAIVIIAIVAAAITPTVDPVNMFLVMLPMSALYFVGIGLSFLAIRRRG
jgi:sec-independent protein translocase protein TatC